MQKTMRIIVAGDDLEVDFEYQPKEKQTSTYPGCDEEVTEIYAVRFIDPAEACDVDHEEIKVALLEQIQFERREAA